MNMLEIRALEVGAKVGVTSRHGSNVSILTVTKRTPTQLTLSDNSRWTLNGKEIGDAGSYTRFLISAALAEANAAAHRAEVEKNIAVNKVATANLRSLTMDQLSRIAAIIEEGK